MDRRHGEDDRPRRGNRPAALDALARGGADLEVLAANTPHLVFDEVRRRSSIPLVSIVEATRDAAKRQGVRRAGILGTRTTMLGGFYQDSFAAGGMTVIPPTSPDQEYVHERYVGELVRGRFLPETRSGFLAVIDRLREREDIDAVILGGTELPLLLREAQAGPILLDTTRIHVEAIVTRILEEKEEA